MTDKTFAIAAIVRLRRPYEARHGKDHGAVRADRLGGGAVYRSETTAYYPTVLWVLPSGLYYNENQLEFIETLTEHTGPDPLGVIGVNIVDLCGCEVRGLEEIPCEFHRGYRVGAESVQYIRCTEHRAVPRFNTQATGAECGACIALGVTPS